MSKNNVTPTIRFKGFNDDWEQRKLGRVTASYSGGTPSAGNKSYYGGDIPFIRSAEINRDSTELFLTDYGLNNSSAKMVEVGNILYALYGATSGEVGISRIDGAINQAILAIKPNDGYNSQFIMQWLRLQKQKIIDKYLQGGQGNLSGSIIKDLQIKFPNHCEQARIGTFFEQLDKTIALHQHELTLLKQRKKAFLQKMFPKKGELHPEIRLNKYSDEWTEVKLDDIGDTFTGLSGKTKEDFGHGEAEFITYKNVFNNFLAKETLVEHVEIDQKQNQVMYGDILFTTSSETPEEVGMSSVWLHDKKNVYLNSFCFGFRLNKDLNPMFLAYYLRSPEVRKKFMVLAQGISRYNISKTKVLQMIIKIPNIDEQHKIGNLFLRLDEDIALHEHRLEKLKQMKKAFLQKMFV